MFEADGDWLWKLLVVISPDELIDAHRDILAMEESRNT